MTVSFIDSIITCISNLYIKPANSHEFLLSSSCHVLCCNKGIPSTSNQAQRLKIIYSVNKLFDRTCNNFEKQLLDRCYNEKMVRKEILRDRAHPRDLLLEKVNNQRHNSKITFDMTYFSAFCNFSKLLKETGMILAPYNRHKNYFRRFP